ncbi:MAG: hypothetical protein PVH25_12100 [Burkholderiales bacterium]
MNQSTPEDDHWLARPENIRRIWIIFSAVLVATVLAQIIIKVKGYFGVDGWFGFAAGFGFVSCALMVVAAKLLGFILKRPDNYYDD